MDEGGTANITTKVLQNPLISFSNLTYLLFYPSIFLLFMIIDKKQTPIISWAKYFDKLGFLAMPIGNLKSLLKFIPSFNL